MQLFQIWSATGHTEYLQLQNQNFLGWEASVIPMPFTGLVVPLEMCRLKTHCRIYAPASGWTVTQNKHYKNNKF